MFPCPSPATTKSSPAGRLKGWRGIALSSRLVNKQPEILQRLSVATNNEHHFPDESFFEMLMKCQGSRIEEQRSSLPPTRGTEKT
ncbi:Uncharacterized protein FKW44_017274 [Caligus rogercresseyi]|uniref:Uncharacterized protein n=1 Tax=Caligus rogercresseyi TaxID=217165 RepID=A0A7T8K106_CALRO|nr:Uncharacterized protein FKW44_017274 [Caligus rogercresseyi]